MVSQSVEQKKYTRQEYLDFEVNAEERHEYLDGEIRVMAGGTPNHNRIIGNFYIALKLALAESRYDVILTLIFSSLRENYSFKKGVRIP